jgi:hypothetical protein
MPDLKRTNEINGHYHLVYVDERSGVAYVSPEKSNGESAAHEHTVVYTPASQALDPETQQSIEIPESVEILDNETGVAHTHFLLDIIFEEVKRPVVDETEEELLVELKALTKQGAELGADFRERGKVCYKFKKGDQWDESIKTDLQNQHRACITVNKIMPIVDSLSGHQRQNRTDIKYFPIENADPRGAEVANILVKHILDKAGYAMQESKVFVDQVTVGRGLLDVYPEFRTKDVDIKIVRYKWDNVFFGPHEYEDCRDLEYIVKTKWFSVGKIKKMYPKKIDEIDQDMASLETGDTIGYTTEERDYDGTGNSGSAFIGGEQVVDIQRKTIRLLELWKKHYVQKEVLVNKSDPDVEFYYEDSERLSKKDLSKAKKIFGFEVEKRIDHEMHIITAVGSTILDKRVHPLKDFNIIPVYARKDDDYIQGVVESLIDLQRQTNKTFSQATDVINFSNNDGWFYEDSTFDKNEEQNFLENCGRPGFAVKLNDIRKAPVKIERGRFPSELVNMMQLSSNEMKEIAGVSNEILGLESNAKSGVAIARRIRQSMTVNDYLFDNLSMAKKQLGKVLLEMIQSFYTPEKIRKVLQDRNQVEPFELQKDGESVPFESYEDEDLIDFLNDVDFTKYDVSVSEGANTPTKNLDRLMMFQELQAQGPITPMMIDLMKSAGMISPADAVKYNKMLEDQAAAEAAAADKDRQAQNERTILGQGINPNTGMPLPADQ